MNVTSVSTIIVSFVFHVFVITLIKFLTTFIYITFLLISYFKGLFLEYSYRT